MTFVQKVLLVERVVLSRETSKKISHSEAFPPDTDTLKISPTRLHGEVASVDFSGTLAESNFYENISTILSRQTTF